MPILVNNASRLLFQGPITEEQGFYLQQSLLYGTKIIGGVGVLENTKKYFDLPIFDAVEDAVRFSSCNVSVIFSPPLYAADAILEAIESEIPLIICITDGIPLHDIAEVMRAVVKSKKSRLIGPGSTGIMTPGECKAGIMPGYIYTQGKIGVISRVQTLAYEACWQITQLGFGQSTHVELGKNGMICGTSSIDLFSLFEQDPETEGILFLEEADVPFEEILALSLWIRKYAKKPIGAYFAGRSLIEGSQKKEELLLQAGVYITENPAMMGQIVATAVLEKKKRG